MIESTVLSLSYGQIVVKPPEKLHGLVPESFETYQIVDPGDIIFRPTDLQNDWVSLRFGLSKNRGIITSAYMCFKPRETITNRFAHLLLHTYDLKKIFYGLGSGLRQNIDWRDFKYLPCLIPPLAEQNAIVRYLDFMDRRIRRYIRAKQKLIKLLNEQKQAVIHQAVTRGLDPNVRLKPSGVEWLGDVPEHWEVHRLKNLGQAIIGLTYKPSDVVDESEGILVLRASNILDGQVNLTDKVYVNCEIPEHLFTRNNDILLCARSGSRELIGKNLKILSDLEAVTFGAFMLVFRSNINDFLYYVFNSKIFELQSGFFLTSTINQLTKNDLYDFKIPIPPLDEQETISTFISESNFVINRLIHTAKKEIDLMREFQNGLISAIVTGKLDVRAAAAALPDEIAAPEALDIEEAPEEDAAPGEDAQEALEGEDK